MALVTELGRKTGVSWLRYGVPPTSHAAWHLWFDDALYVLSGGAEQQLPGIEELPEPGRVEVTMRSKDNGGRLLTWVARATAVLPGDERWQPVTAALAADRLNVPDLATAPAGWARTSRVTRLEPTGELVEQPGALTDGAHLATPVPTPATTRGPLPRVLHRRVRRRPKLS
ncbi:hypothetical protein H9L09_14385 [Nocardioides mesophilus]|uniref:Pyridoxamine 5'-phosphate oxidase family protein n=1 Tax=Nocardioides mesophilus TaxID=433659 RepID=A0A7G9RHI7_9ACTN|nr:hypothetical protein H9L09_14385 [Nocardioides mesophilus]